jgi:hypothetical protein
MGHSKLLLQFEFVSSSTLPKGGAQHSDHSKSVKSITFSLPRALNPRELEVDLISEHIHISVLGMLCVLQMNLLLFVSVTTAVLLPGMKHHGLLEKYFAEVVVRISETIKGMKEKKN